MVVAREAYKTQLAELGETIAKLGEKTLKSIRQSGEMLANSDMGLAEDIIARRRDIDRLRRTVEDSCMSLMLLQQPMASDMRFVTSAFRSVRDLGRIAEMALDIAELEDEMDTESVEAVGSRLRDLSEKSADMVETALSAFVSSDADVAEQVFEMDNGVDEAFLALRATIVDELRSDEEDVSARTAPELLMIAKYYERIGDHAQSVADWAIFRATGTYRGHQLGQA